MKIAADYAAKNRLLMTRVLFDFLEGDRLQGFDTVHNYIEIKAEGSHILRKGAVASYAGDILTIPLNMRDGILICEGLRNRLQMSGAWVGPANWVLETYPDRKIEVLWKK